MLIHKCITNWLNQVDNAQPTWNHLVEASKKRTVKGNVQAKEILEDLKSKAM